MGNNSQPVPSACKFLYDDDCTSIFQIPSRLVKNYGDEIPKVATLRVPHSDKYWKVCIEKFKGQYFFTDGWKEFAEQVDMKTREYLLFKDAGFSDFRVSPEKAANNGTEEGIGRMSDYAKTRSSCLNVTGGSSDVVADGSLRFTLELQTYHCSRVDMPRDFARSAGLDKSCEIKLRDGEGVEWPVDVIERGGYKRGLQFALSKGWSRFRTSNNLVVGNIVSFVLISADTMQVQLVKQGTDEMSNYVKSKQESSENMDMDVKSESESEREDLFMEQENGSIVAYDRLENIGDEDSGPDEEEDSIFGKRWRFIKKLKRNHVYRLGIPRVFVRDTGIAADSRIKLKNAEGKEWPVSVTDKGCGQFHFSGGWHDFLEGNNVVVGSRLVFEFIPSSDNTVEARVVKAGRDRNALFKFVKVNCENKDTGAVKGRRPSITKDLRNGRRSSFTKEMLKHYAYTLDIPKDFLSDNRMAKKNKIKLRDVEGRKWKVYLSKRNEQFRFSTGWNDFLKGNNIAIGSTLAFFRSSSDMVDVQLVKEGPDKQALYKYLRKVDGKLELMEADEISDLERGHEKLNKASDNAEVPTNSVLNINGGNGDHSSSEEEMELVLKSEKVFV